MNATREPDDTAAERRHDVREQRVLLLLPTGRDFELARAELERAGLSPLRCRSLPSLVKRVAAGCGVAVIAEEALTRRVRELFDALDGQPGWSALPLVVLIRQDGPAPSSLGTLRAFERHAKIKATFLKRPVPGMSLVSTVRSGLSSRIRQYQVRDLLRQLEGEIKARDEFLAMLGHELRNPVASIAHIAELFGMAGESLAPETARWGAAVIRRQVQQLSRLLDQLLDAARVQSGKIELHSEPVDLRALIEHSVEALRPAAGARKLHLDLPVEELLAWGDPVRLRQVADNLLDNACKYTGEDGNIWLSLRRDGGLAVLSVRDDGKGLSEEALPRIFEPFYQDAGKHAPGSSGLGLGLAMVDRLVKMHGGHIEARSDGPGQGAVFEVCLPLAESGDARGSASAAGPFAARARKLLIVEDNAEVADLLALLLESLGHEAHVAYEGEQGVRLAQELAPDLVFVDIGLPDISGREVARRVRAALDRQAPPLVALTGYPQRAADGETPDPFDEYVLKPISRDRIQSILDALP